MNKLDISFSIFFEEEDLDYMDEHELAGLIVEFIEEQLVDINIHPSEIVINRVELEK